VTLNGDEQAWTPADRSLSPARRLELQSTQKRPARFRDLERDDFAPQVSKSVPQGLKPSLEGLYGTAKPLRAETLFPAAPGFTTTAMHSGGDWSGQADDRPVVRG
jgi:hypothetical protein